VNRAGTDKSQWSAWLSAVWFEWAEVRNGPYMYLAVWWNSRGLTSYGNSPPGTAWQGLAWLCCPSTGKEQSVPFAGVI